jgi:hypothetical protein
VQEIDADAQHHVLSARTDAEGFRAAQVSLGAVRVLTAVNLALRTGLRLRAIHKRQPEDKFVGRCPTSPAPMSTWQP